MESISKAKETFVVGKDYSYSTIESAVEKINKEFEDSLIEEKLKERLKEIESDTEDTEDDQEVDIEEIKDDLRFELQEEIEDNALELESINEDGNIGESFVTIKVNDVVASFVLTGYSTQGIFTCCFVTNV